MPSEFCGYCDKNIDIKASPEHFPDEYWEGDSKCQVEIDEDRWNTQAHWGDHINKKNKENRANTFHDHYRDKLNNRR